MLFLQTEDLSVCLFHAMFGGECRPVEFANMRPSHYLDDFPDAQLIAWKMHEVKILFLEMLDRDDRYDRFLLDVSILCLEKWQDVSNLDSALSVSFGNPIEHGGTGLSQDGYPKLSL